MDDDRIYINDIRELGYCVRGIRDWFKGYGYDLRDVARNGVPIKEIEAIDDDLGREVVRSVRQKRLRGDR